MIKIKNVKKLSYIAMSGFLVLQNPMGTVYANEVSVTENKDNEVITYFEEVKNKLESSEWTDSVKESVATSFITVTDFLFFEGEIKGVTLEDISEETKETIYDLYSTIVTKFDEKFPEASNWISEKYSITKDWFKESYNTYCEDAKDLYFEFKESAGNYITEKFGEENVEQFKGYYEQAKDQLSDDMDVIGELYNDGKSELGDWYKGLKKKYGK